MKMEEIVDINLFLFWSMWYR